MVDMPTGNLYAYEPSVVTQMENFIQDTLKYMSTAMSLLPIDASARPIDQNVEWLKKNFRTGIKSRMDIVNPPDVDEDIQRIQKDLPITYFNKTLKYQDYQREQLSAYDLVQRMNDHLEQMALRLDIYTYAGDSRNGVGAFIDQGTELSTALDVSTTALAATTTAAMILQLKQAGKRSGLVSPQSDIVIEVTPSLWEELSVQSTNEDFNARDAINKELRAAFPNATGVVENWLLDATIAYDAVDVHSITESTADKALIYPRDPRAVYLKQSRPGVYQSPLDPTKGITFQPHIRHRRVDVETAVILKETGATVS